ncbi:MAG TPA: EAL domain-containing response regulator [Xanthobacteraceae bacterium]|jgi:EAL domain-containing protein (putative c-di-GMP-specific phosphodiesterase class I)|nr:EAL domain-containing response regulator [Xanthobacteraceae bacterium]
MDALQNPEPLRTALVLDDEVEIGALVCKVLSGLGVAIRHFTDPLPFLLEVQRAAPDILFLDLVLGRADAVDVIRKLEFLKFSGRVHLISGRDEATLREFERVGKAHGLRMMRSLKKTFRVAELKAAMAASVAAGQAEPDGRAPIASAPGAAGILKEALDREWLEVWYQPKIDLRSLSVCGAEALIRARHPARGIIEPANLLPPAGDPLYKPLTTFVVRRAIVDWLAFAQRGRPMKLSVNAPVSVLSAPGFVDFMRKALPAHPEFPGVIVEVAEDEAIRDMDRLHEIATQLRLYNVAISIDDFGSAYASLLRIKYLPFDEVKLDRGFVAGCASNDRKRALCQAVAELAHCFGASACAEGVETLDDLRCLANIGFDTAQGVVFARPMPVDHFVDFITAQQDAGVNRAHAPSAGGAVSSAQT